ncbi:hypothetical protein AQ804_14845 [Burkholderia pseudomallei]|nr:hypothetical protein AQ804_14845 [Burkholderia pseudomallei]
MGSARVRAARMRGGRRERAAAQRRGRAALAWLKVRLKARRKARLKARRRLGAARRASKSRAMPARRNTLRRPI